MNSSNLEALKKLVAPPKTVPKPPIDWTEIERLLCARFPDDYKAYVDAYGTGHFNGLGVGDVRHGDLVNLTNALGACQVLKREGRDVVENDTFFPEVGGLFPIGNTDNGDTLWLRLADGGVVFTDGDDTERDEEPQGLTAFLVNVLSGKKPSPILADSFGKKKPAFTPFRKKTVVSFAFAPPFPAFAEVASALKAFLGKAKALKEKSYVVQYETSLVSITAGTSNESFYMSAIYREGDEAAVRELVEEFFAKASITPTAITDYAKNPVWQPATPSAASDASAVRDRIAPPSTPEGSKGNWSTLERVLGTGLPGDFRELIETYGSGTFGGSLRLFNPFAENPEHALVRQWFERLPALHLRRDSYPAASGLVPFIKSGTTLGLLPIGLAKDGVLCFDVRGGPAAWKVVFLTNMTDTKFEAHTFDGGIAAFINAALDGKVEGLAGALRPTFER